MKSDLPFVWGVRISWPLLGGVWGAMAWFGGYHGIADNADSFGTMLMQGFFIATGIIVLVAGMTCGGLVGGLTEKALRYFGVRIVYALCVATVVNVLVIWQLIGMLQAKSPGFRTPVNKSNVMTKPKESSTYKLRSDNPCAQPPPPANTKERSWWDTECR